MLLTDVAPDALRKVADFLPQSTRHDLRGTSRCVASALCVGRLSVSLHRATRARLRFGTGAALWSPLLLADTPCGTRLCVRVIDDDPTQREHARPSMAAATVRAVLRTVPGATLIFVTDNEMVASAVARVGRPRHGNRKTRQHEQDQPAATVEVRLRGERPSRMRTGPARWAPNIRIGVVDNEMATHNLHKLLRVLARAHPVEVRLSRCVGDCTADVTLRVVADAALTNNAERVQIVHWFGTRLGTIIIRIMARAELTPLQRTGVLVHTDAERDTEIQRSLAAKATVWLGSFGATTISEAQTDEWA